MLQKAASGIKSGFHKAKNYLRGLVGLPAKPDSESDSESDSDSSSLSGSGSKSGGKLSGAESVSGSSNTNYGPKTRKPSKQRSLLPSFLPKTFGKPKHEKKSDSDDDNDDDDDSDSGKGKGLGGLFDKIGKSAKKGLGKLW